MKIAILGAGAMGCLFGARLSKENKVTMICNRSEQAAEINRLGIRVYETDGNCYNYKENVTACVTGQCTMEFDLVVVMTKTHDIETALDGNRKIFLPHTKVLTLQNGGGNAERLEKFISKENIFLGTTTHNIVNLGNGVIRNSGSGVTYIGSYLSGQSVSEIVEMFNRAGIKTEETLNAKYLIWRKLFVNLSVNSFTAIARAPIGSVISSSNAWYYIEKVICEAVDVARADGQDFSYDEVLTMIHKACESVSSGFTSMSQDVMNCRKTEIDGINGFVVSQGKLYNISTPYNEFVINLVHAIESTYQYQEMPSKRFAAGDIILKEGQENSNLYKVVDGKVELYAHYGEKEEYLIGILSEGQCFGEVSALTGKKELSTAVAFSDTVVMEISKENHRRFISLNPENAEKMLKMMAHNLELYRINTEMAISNGRVTE